MPRTLRTLLLSATALGALATAATASPSLMHPGMGDMVDMHASMTADPAMHESMLQDPTMQAHMAEYGIDADQMRRWHESGASIGRIHAALAKQGVDVASMQADCPMLMDGSMPMDGSMAGMHRGAGADHVRHHGNGGR